MLWYTFNTMLRTRDYAIGLSVIVFLMVGIGLTLIKQGNLFGGGLSAAVFVSQPVSDSSSASVSREVEVSREERIASLRKKIASLGVTESEPETPAEEVVATSTETTNVVVKDIEEQRCSFYAPYSGSWNSRGVSINEEEGARIVYREATPSPIASSTTALPAPSKQILLELPVKSLPAASTHCIASDVIGITKHGTLIRNDEILAYRTFDAGTLIGYALDGFPIYGGSNVQTDTCGGVAVKGQYRYYLHPDRNTMISCFAAPPVTL